MPTGDLVPAGALSYDLSDDLTTYTFKLRPEAKWSNGDPVVAGDYVYGWQRLVDPATASEYAWYMELMQVVNAGAITRGEKPMADLGVKAVDDLTLEVKIEAPLPYFPKMLSHASTYPINKKAIDQFGADWTKPGNFIGNGAYVLTEHLVGEKVVMEKSPTYWDAANVIMSPITGVTINDENAAWTRYEAGELDRSTVPSGQFPRLAAEFPDEVLSNPSACSYNYIINIADGKGNAALKDVRVRKALSLCDRPRHRDRQHPAGRPDPGLQLDAVGHRTVSPCRRSTMSAMTQDERNEGRQGPDGRGGLWRRTIR